MDRPLLQALVTALLSVNQYPLAKVEAVMPEFEKSGLLDPARAAAMPQAELIAAFEAAGYRRGGYLPILSFRYAKLMEGVRDGELNDLEPLVARHDKAGFLARLRALHGFGPTTAMIAWQLVAG